MRTLFYRCHLLVVANWHRPFKLIVLAWWCLSFTNGQIFVCGWMWYGWHTHHIYILYYKIWSDVVDFDKQISPGQFIIKTSFWHNTHRHYGTLVHIIIGEGGFLVRFQQTNYKFNISYYKRFPRSSFGLGNNNFHNICLPIGMLDIVCAAHTRACGSIF